MRRSPSPSSPRRRPWHARAEFRLGALVAALLIGAGIAAALRDGGGGAASEPPAVAVAAATATPAAIPTASATTAPTPSPPATPTPQPTSEPTSEPNATSTPLATATPTPTATATPTPTATATAAPPAVVPDLELRPSGVGPGETLLVVATAPGAAAATLEFRGGSFRLLPRDDGFWGVFAVPLGAPLGPETLRVTLRDAAGDPLGAIDGAYEVVHIERPIDYITLTPDQASVLSPEASAQEAALRGEQFAQFDPDPLWATSFEAPVLGPITSQFGVGRSFNGAPVSGFHGGTDYGGEEGTPVSAAGPGRVSWAGEMPIRGNSVIVDHGGGVKSGYHHLSRIDVATGDAVATGKQLGAIGATGLVTGPHLHWELTIWGVNVDPVTWLSESFVP